MLTVSNARATEFNDCFDIDIQESRRSLDCWHVAYSTSINHRYLRLCTKLTIGQQKLFRLHGFEIQGKFHTHCLLKAFSLLKSILSVCMNEINASRSDYIIIPSYKLNENCLMIHFLYLSGLTRWIVIKNVVVSV